MKVCVLVSGGMDSVVALHESAGTHNVVTALSFDYGSKHNARELSHAAWQCRALNVPHQVLSLPFINETFGSDLLQSGGEIPLGHYAEENMKRTVVPFRNGIMLAIAAGFAESRGAEALVIAAHAGDHTIYPDCRAEFMSAMTSAIREGTYARLEILTPFLHATKSAIASRGAALGVDFSHTWSCYCGRELHCGACGTCVERREAFLLAKIPDPTAYEATPPLPLPPQP
jgi:7-cyano-7-deazaguanine synthase